MDFANFLHKPDFCTQIAQVFSLAIATIYHKTLANKRFILIRAMNGNETPIAPLASKTVNEAFAGSNPAPRTIFTGEIGHSQIICTKPFVWKSIVENLKDCPDARTNQT
jgi:hypothetical protein